MNMVNNFDQIEKLLEFSNDGDFYLVRVYKVDESKNGDYNIKDFGITSIENLNEVKNQIIELCIMNGAHAYIYLNRRNFKSVGLKMIGKISESMAMENYADIQEAYRFSCLESHSEPEESEKWSLELFDFTEEEDHFVQGVLGAISPEGPKVKASVPGTQLSELQSSLNLVTNQFDSALFFEKYHEIWKTAKTIFLEKDAQVLLFHA